MFEKLMIPGPPRIFQQSNFRFSSKLRILAFDSTPTNTFLSVLRLHIF